MKSRGTLTVKRGKSLVDIPLQSPKPTWKGDKLIIQTDNGRERVPRDEIVGWQWDKKTH